MQWLRNSARVVFGARIGGVRIFPIATKIVLVYVLFILLSNFSSHYISLMLYRSELVKQARQLLVRDLKDAYTFANTQYEIFHFSGNRDQALRRIEEKALLDFKHRKSLLLGLARDGRIEINAARTAKPAAFTDAASLAAMRPGQAATENEGFISFSLGGEKYFGVYKHNPSWDMLLVRAEEFGEFNEDSNRIFRTISVLIVVITIACAAIGVFIINYVLRFVRLITADIMRMTREHRIGLIDMHGSQADDVTFMGMAFNSLAGIIGTMMNIFQKFTNKDIVLKAYEEKRVRLEGSRRELTCLFSDIKSFTYMTEVLGTDIITLLNLHYTSAIGIILRNDGIIGSIIGDALLAVYGVFGEESARMKSYQAVVSGYKTHEVAAEIRAKMQRIRDDIVEKNGKLTPLEEKVYKAVLIEVGVGIDGGHVFYGNIGSYERMTNTVIGDTVNSASRLEGLNRVYHAPVICSEYVVNDIKANVPDHGLEFFELDLVKVKGKTEGKRVFWPIFKKDITPAMRADLRHYSAGLKLYYAGKWKQAHARFRQCSLPAAAVFLERTGHGTCPKNWKGIWTMETK